MALAPLSTQAASAESLDDECRVLDGNCGDEPTGAMAVAKAMSRLAALRSVLSNVSSQLQVSVS